MDATLVILSVLGAIGLLAAVFSLCERRHPTVPRPKEYEWCATARDPFRYREHGREDQ